LSMPRGRTRRSRTVPTSACEDARAPGSRLPWQSSLERSTPDLALIARVRQRDRPRRRCRVHACDRAGGAPAARPGRGAREGGSASALSGARRMAALLPRHRHDDRDDLRRRVARHRSLRIATRPCSLPRPRAESPRERRLCASRQDHEDRQRSHSSRTRAGVLAISTPASRRSGTASTPRRATRACFDNRRRGATASDIALPATDRSWEDAQQGDHRDRARAGGLSVGGAPRPGPRSIRTAKLSSTEVGQRREARKEKRASRLCDKATA